MLTALHRSRPLVLTHIPRRPLPTDGPAPQAARLKIVTSLTTYGAIAREIVGDKGTVTSIAQGDEDPHFVQPKPSFVAVLRDADLFVTTGLDLELWVPALLDRAGNRKVSEGGPGLRRPPSPASTCSRCRPRSAEPRATSTSTATRTSTPIRSTASSSRGTSSAGLQRVSPENARLLRRPGAGFREAGARGHHGAGAGGRSSPRHRLSTCSTATSCSTSSRQQKYQGKPLLDRLGGWLKQAEVFRGKEMACYHKEWAYFSHRFKVDLRRPTSRPSRASRRRRATCRK